MRKNDTKKQSRLFLVVLAIMTPLLLVGWSWERGSGDERKDDGFQWNWSRKTRTRKTRTLQRNPDIELASGKHGIVLQRASQLVIDVDRRGDCWVENRRVTLEQLKHLVMGSYLEDLDFPCMVRADRKARHEHVRKVFQACLSGQFEACTRNPKVSLEPKISIVALVEAQEDEDVYSRLDVYIPCPNPDPDASGPWYEDYSEDEPEEEPPPPPDVEPPPEMDAPDIQLDTPTIAPVAAVKDGASAEELREYVKAEKKIGPRTAALLKLALMQREQASAALDAADKPNDVAMLKNALHLITGAIRDFREVENVLSAALKEGGASLDPEERKQYLLRRGQAIFFAAASWERLMKCANAQQESKIRRLAVVGYEKYLADYPNGQYAPQARDACTRLQGGLPKVDVAPPVKRIVTAKTPMAALRDAGNIVKKISGGAQYGDANTERAVRMALRWLKATQAPDGSWGIKPELDLKKGMDKAAGAGFAVLTFLAHGETPDSPEFGPTVEKALNYLIDSVYVVKDKSGQEVRDPNGRAPYVRMRGAGGSEYGFLIGTYALCEAYAMTGDPRVKAAAEKTLARIISGQTPTGGWNYNLARVTKDGAPDDISYGGWALQALKAGKMAGIHLPGMEECIKKAVRCLKTRNYSEKAGFVYRATTNHKGGSGCLGGVGCLAMQLLGYATDPAVRNALEVMRDWQPSLEKEYSYVKYGMRSNPQYYCYYATQCKYQAGMSPRASPVDITRWKKWNTEMKALYTKSIVKVLKEDGSPYMVKDAKGMDREIGHWVNQDLYNYDVMGTCLAALQLMVYYRYSPAMQLKATAVE